MKKHLALSLLAGLAVSACADSHFEGRAGLTMTENRALPTPDDHGAVGTVSSYVIGAGDKLSISVFGLPELGTEALVDLNGDIGVPLAGQVHAAGLTPAQFSDLVKRRLDANHVRDARVSVNVLEANSRVFTVEGSVQKPGLYPVQLQAMTLVRAIAVAGSPTEFAKENEVIVYRTVDGKRYAGLYNLESIRNGIYQDPTICAGDVIVVGKSAKRGLFKDILSTTPLITPIIYLLTR